MKEFINGGTSYTAILPSTVDDLGQFTQVAVVTSPVSCSLSNRKFVATNGKNL